MTKDEALKLALTALEINQTLLKKITPYERQEDLLSDSIDITQNTITAIKEALAQPEQAQDEDCKYCTDGCPACDAKKLPPQRKPLTDEEIDLIYTGVRAVHHEIDSYVFARAIEAAHDIKENT